MEKFVIKDGKKLRFGYTTGTCAAAAAKAAAMMLLSGETVDTVNVVTPSDVSLFLEISDIKREDNAVSCSVVKDAGDDPDVTHGIKIFAKVSRWEGDGIVIDGGEGIGRVTLPGLQVEVGKAAINPVPYKMIETELGAVAKKYGCCGLSAVIYVPRGLEVSKKTFNARLGIEGGISILGTTGIVEPMSEKALIDTIHIDIKMQVARGVTELIITPGNYGMEFIRKNYGYELDNAVKCSNFIGDALDYAAHLELKRVTLIGHAGKILKLAAGIMNTLSRTADGRMEILSAHAAMAGAGAEKIKMLMECVTTEAAIDLLDEWKLTEPVMKTVTAKIKYNLTYRLGQKTLAGFIMFIGDRVLASDLE